MNLLSLSILMVLAAAPDAGVAPPSSPGVLDRGQQDAMERARRLIQAGQHAPALQALKDAGLDAPRREVPVLSGMLATAAMGTSDAPRAEEALRALQGHPTLPSLARAMVDIRLLEVCQTRCGAPAITQDDVVRLPLPAQARLLQAMTARGLKETGPLALHIKGATDWNRGPSDERAALVLATHAALVAGGQDEAARELQLRAWEEMPGEPALIPLLAPLDDAQLVSQLGQARALRHLEALAEANRNEEVIRFGGLLCGEKVIAGKRVCPSLAEGQRCLVGYLVGKAQRQSRQYPAAEETLGVVASQCREYAPRALYLQARSMSAQRGGSPRAVKTYEALVKQHSDHRLADDALLLAGQLLARGKGRNTARAFWQRVVKQYPDGDMGLEAAWWLAWELKQRGKDKQAVQQLDALAAQAERTSLPMWRRAQYWRARLGSDERRSILQMQELLDRAPQSYEAALARGWLKRHGVKPIVVNLGPPVDESFPTPSALDPQAEAALALSSVGLDEDAVALLKVTGLLTPGSKGAGTGLHAHGDLWVAAQLIAVGDAATASRHLRYRHTGGLLAPLSRENATLFRLAYPAAHAHAIREATAAEGMPTELLFALAREESAFDARVVSWAGAIGLTQLMPATAAMESKTLGYEKPELVALLDPSLNARLGAAHLARDLRLFNGNPALALAAYNAGPGAVRAWLRRGDGADLDEFVENIPIEETRGYVKRVLESYSIYLMLSGQEPLVLPEKPTDRLITLR